jgi:hypothetical protein
MKFRSSTSSFEGGNDRNTNTGILTGIHRNLTPPKHRNLVALVSLDSADKFLSVLSPAALRGF